MPDAPKFLLVDMKVLPDVFYKVIQAKKLIAQGKARSSSEAAKMAGISRSAFYKYKDSVYQYENKSSQRIATLYVTLEDEPGVLSSVLSELYQIGANIITVNQNIPVDGVAPVSISCRVNQEKQDDELVEALAQVAGVVEARTIAAQ